jgi:hypothetical protein
MFNSLIPLYVRLDSGEVAVHLHYIDPANLLLILGFVTPTAGSTLPHKSSRKQLHGGAVIPRSRVDRYVISTWVLPKSLSRIIKQKAAQQQLKTL